MRFRTRPGPRVEVIVVRLRSELLYEVVCSPSERYMNPFLKNGFMQRPESLLKYLHDSLAQPTSLEIWGLRTLGSANPKFPSRNHPPVLRGRVKKNIC